MRNDRPTRDRIVWAEHNIGDFERWLDRITLNQLPYATSLALTRTAQSAQDVLRQRLSRHFTVRSNWVARGIQVQAANKRDTLRRMHAIVGSLDPFMERQELSGTKRGRSGKDVAVPLDIRQNKRAVTRPGKWPKALLRKGGRRPYFVGKIASGKWAGTPAVFRRESKASYPLRVMYLLRPDVDVPAHWDLRRTVDEIAPRAFPFQMDAALERAIRSAR